MTRRILVAVAGAWLVTTGVAGASEQSKRLYSRGLVDFHAGRYPQALALFDEAVADDAADVYARYYRAVTRGRLDNYDGAISDLRAVLAAKPDLDPAALELGVALVQTNAYREALPWLTQAQRVDDLAAQASMFLGLAQLRLGETEPAHRNFERAAAKDEALRVVAQYYLGVSAYQESRWSDAAAHFTAVTQANPDTEIGREAAAFLIKLREGERALFSVFGAVGFQYDSNVVLAPADEIVKDAASITKQADGRFTLNAGGNFVAWHNDSAQLSLGYEFYQSLHFELHNFNLEDHRPSIQFVGHVGPVQYGVQGRYDYYLLDTDSFLEEGTALPWVTIVSGDAGRTELSYRVRRRDFISRAFKVRDTFNHSPAVQQVIYLGSPDRYLTAGYRFDRDDPVVDNADHNQFAYDGNEVNGGIGWALPAGITAEANYAYRHERYAQESARSPGDARRHDDQHQVVVAVQKDLSAHLRLTAAYLGTANNSNQSPFDYTRHIASLALEVRF